MTEREYEIEMLGDLDEFEDVDFDRMSDAEVEAWADFCLAEDEYNGEGSRWDNGEYEPREDDEDRDWAELTDRYYLDVD